jgi:arylsulfatase A-like enzyme
MSDHRKVPIYDFDPTGRYPQARQQVGQRFSSELFADAAIEFLQQYRGKKPFFALVSFTAPHDPRTPPGEYARMYDPARIPLPANFFPQHPFDNGELKVRDEQLAPFPRTPEVVRQHLADYYGMISHLDAQIGRILEVLKSSPFASETVVVFASDNGLAVGQHGLLGKQNLYEHSVRVPLILAGPGISPGQSSALVYLHDVYPTLCEILGIPVAEGVEAQSVLPIIRGEASVGRNHLLFAYRQEQRALREGPWKLIRYRVAGVETVQLFHLAEDPWERTNLAEDPQYSQLRQTLLERLAAACREAGDTAAE